jgi:polar amino acid transport system ATP-binding protein
MSTRPDGSSQAAKAAIEVHGLTKSYGSLTVLDGVSLRVDAGEVAVVIGPSGGGKSTLLRCMAMLETPDSGTVLRNGVPFGAWTDAAGKRIRPRQRDIQRGRSKMPMVFQRFHLFSNLTVLGNVMVAQRSVLKRPKAEAERVARETLSRVGLSDKLHAYPVTLSGGQQQRVGIARALAMDPDIILLDEPTSSLDPELVGEVLQIIRELADTGTTMIITTHEMGFARQIASHVHFMEGGVVVESGTPADIFENPARRRTADFVRGSHERRAVSGG